MKHIALGILLLLIYSTNTLAFDQTHAEWGKVLKMFMVQKDKKSFVDYKGIQKNPAALNSYLASTETVRREEFDKWNESKKIAFLINVYNARTIKLILNHYPVKSIRDIGGIFNSPWKKEFFKLFGENSYLDYIEHDLLRRKFDEPRIHFGLNCASKGCPPLFSEPFTGDKLDKQLEIVAVQFLTDPDRNYYDSEKNTLRISSIFKWFGDDFKKGDSTVQKFVAPRMAKSPEEEKKIRNAAIKVLDYDWSLNEKEGT